MKQVRYFITTCLLFCILYSNAQLQLIDSLRQKLATETVESNKSNLLYEICFAWKNTNQDSMLFYARQLAQFSEKNKNNLPAESEAFALDFLGFALLAKQNLPEAQSTLFKALASAKEDSTKVFILNTISTYYLDIDHDSCVYYLQKAVLLCEKNKENYPAAISTIALANLGYGLWYVGNYPDAKETYFKALQKAEITGDTLLIAGAYDGIAIVNRNEGNYRQAINYYTKSEGLKRSIRNDEGLIGTLMDKGKAYEQLNILDTALKCLQAAMVIAEKKYKGKKGLGGGAQSEMGIIYSKLGNEKLAEQYFRQSFPLHMESNNHRLLARANVEFAEHFDRYQQTDSALYYATKGLLIDQQFHFLVQQLAASTLLSKLYTKENNIDSAFKYQRIMIETRDSVFSQEKMNRLQSLEFNEQLRQQEITILKEKAAQERKQNLLATGLLSILIVASILYWNNRQKQKTNKVLEHTLDNLKSTQAQLIQSEKMASLGELTAGIAHEIQNPLNFVNNFSEVNNELIDEMMEELSKGDVKEATLIADDIKQNLEKINHHGKRADAIVKGMLQHSRSSSGIKELTGLNALADEYLRLSYHGLRAKDKSFNATLITDFDATIGSICIIPQDIGRVLLNLYNNAFYAVVEKKKQQRENYEPTVSVSTKKTGDKIEVRVIDNGNGIPQKVMDKIFQPFFTTKPTGEGTGLGLSLSYDIVKAHGGEIKVESKVDEGSEFIIQLPFNNSQ